MMMKVFLVLTCLGFALGKDLDGGRDKDRDRDRDRDREEACRVVAKIAIEEKLKLIERDFRGIEGIERDWVKEEVEEEFFRFCLGKILRSEISFFLNGRRPRTEYIGHLIKKDLLNSKNSKIISNEL